MATPNNTVPHRGRVFQNWKTQTFPSFFSFKSESRRSGGSGEGPQVDILIFIAFFLKCGGTPSLGMDPSCMGRVAAGGIASRAC